MLSGAGNAMDLPGSVVRDILAGRNPIDQIATPFSDQNRTTGRQLARDYGMAGDQDNWGNYLGGMAAEMAFDPLSYVGIGMLGKAGKAMSRNPLDNIAADGMSQAGRHVNNVQNALTHRNYMATHNPPTSSYLDMLDDAIGPAPVDDMMFADIPFARKAMADFGAIPSSKIRPTQPPGRGTTGVYGKGGDGTIVGKPAIPDPYTNIDDISFARRLDNNPGFAANYYRNTASDRIKRPGNLPITGENLARRVEGTPNWWTQKHDDYDLARLIARQRQMARELKERWGTNKSYGFGDDIDEFDDLGP